MEPLAASDPFSKLRAFANTASHTLYNSGFFSNFSRELFMLRINVSCQQWLQKDLTHVGHDELLTEQPKGKKTFLGKS